MRNLIYVVIVVAVVMGAWYAFVAKQEASDIPATDQVYRGTVVFGAEVRTFTPCGGKELWVIGTSPAYQEIFDRARELTSSSAPYTPVFAELSGSMTDAPADGYGAEYSGGFWANRLVSFIPGGHCE